MLFRSLSHFSMGDSTGMTIEKILQASSDGYWRALKAAMDIVPEQGMSLIIDRLDMVEHQKREFALKTCAFIGYL